MPILEPGLITPYRGGQRPLYPFALNYDSPQAQGLVAWWSMLPPASPLIVDHCGQNNLTITGSPPNIVNDLFGGFVFTNNGSSGYAAGKLTNDFNFYDYSFTISFWLNTTNNSAFQVITSTITNSSFSGWEISNNIYLTNSLGFWNGSAWMEVTGVCDGNWHHCAVVFNNPFVHSTATYQFYIDGIQQTTVYVNGSPTTPTQNNPTTNTSTNFNIGQREQLGMEYFSGSLFDFRVYHLIPKASSEILEMWDPRTRWDAYYQLNKRIFSFKTGVTTFTYTASGSLHFSNTATYKKTLRYTPSGSLHFSNAATYKKTLPYSSSGSLHFSNAATYKKTLPYSSSGSLHFSNVSTAKPTYRYTPSASLRFSNSASYSIFGTGASFIAGQPPYQPVIGQVGETITIYGSGFTGATAVVWQKSGGGTVNSVTFTVVSDGVISAVIPATATSGIVGVTVGSTTFSVYKFFVHNNFCGIGTY